MNKIVGNMTDMLGRLLGEDVSLQLNYSQSPAMVEADAGMMEQVLLNLAVNARDAMPRGGQLGVRISIVEVNEDHVRRHPEARVGSFVCVSKSDTGCGIPPENLPRIFEPFFTTKEIGKGTGLGLATVYGIVKQHQGWIEVESTVGKGTTFRIYIPYVGTEQPKRKSPRRKSPFAAAPKPSCSSRTKSPCGNWSRASFKNTATKFCRPATAPKPSRSGVSTRTEIALLLTDLVMPDNMNGRELAETLVEGTAAN